MELGGTAPMEKEESRKMEGGEREGGGTGEAYESLGYPEPCSGLLPVQDRSIRESALPTATARKPNLLSQECMDHFQTIAGYFDTTSGRK